MVQQTRIVIVGAGPTGLSMAAQLIRYGIDFIILEKNEKTTHLSKAVVVQARTLEIFQELGLSEKAVNEGQITTAINLFYKGRRKLAVNLSGLGEGISPFPFALSLEQSKTEKLLVDYLIENGREIQWKSEFIRYEEQDRGVVVYYRDASGQEQKIDADFLVGSDGASSLVRHQMGSTFEGDTVPKIFYVADVKLKSDVINSNELFMFMIRKGFVLFFPMEGEMHYRVVGILPDAKEIDVPFEFADIKDKVRDQILIPVDFEEVNWFSSYKVHSRKASTFKKGRCFIAGDAAHIHTPAGGQGMNTGIQDAYNLAWKLALEIRGELKPEVLETYNVERVENARHLLQTTDRMFEIMSGANAFWNFIRLNLFTRIIGWITKSETIRKRIFPLISQTSISYSKSELTIDSSLGKVKAGVRMPYFVFADSKQIFDYLMEPAFKILFFGDEDQNESIQLRTVYPKLVLKSFQEVTVALFGKETNFYVLLRPDNHISYIGRDLKICKDFFKKILSLEKSK